MSAKDVPFEEAVRQGVELIQRGHAVQQKFTCSACGARNTMDTINLFYKSGRCQDCNHITDIEARGCGYTLIMNLKGQNPADELGMILERFTR